MRQDQDNFNSMTGQYELKCTPDDIISESFKDLRVCDKHYSSLSARGHKPPKGTSSTKSRSDAQLGILKTTPWIVTCSQCNNKVCLSSDVPCKKHNISVFKHLVSVACKFLDERNGNKTDLHNDLYSCIDPFDGTFPDYICMSCQPFFLKSIKIKNEYNETKNIFQEKQSFSTSMIMQPDINHDNKQDLCEESITNPTKKQSNISADKKVLGRDFNVPDDFLFRAGIFTEVF